MPSSAKHLFSLSCVLLLTAGVARAQDADLDHPPFDFSDAFYLQNGIDPATLVGRPDGTPPGSVIDHATPHGPQFNDVRVLELAAAFDSSGHPIFFYVTGLPVPESFLPGSAGDQAFEIAEQFKVYEFPRADNPPLSVFPKRQDLIADLSGGYFSEDVLGVWQVNLVRYTPAAFQTAAGQQALAELAADNGLDLDGTPLVRTKSEVLGLQQKGLVTIETPPVGFGRWFFCPVLKDPQGGEIAPDAHLTIVEQADGSPLAAEREIFDLFHCLQSTDEPCDPADQSSLTVRAGVPPNPLALTVGGEPVLGTALEVGIDHATFVPGALVDLVAVGHVPLNAPIPGIGTLLVSPFAVLGGPAGGTVELPIPLQAALVGFAITVQGAAQDTAGVFHLTNAVDGVIGTH